MRIVAVSRLRPGMRLGRPVYSCSSGVRLPLLQPDALVTEQVRRGLERAGVFAVYIEDGLSEGISPTEAIPAELRDRAVRELGDTFAAIATGGRSTRIPGEQIERLGGVVQAVLRELRESGHMVSALVMSLAGTAFPIELVTVFKHAVAPYPEGVAVRLSDGRRGLVSRVTREHISRPRVRVTHDPAGAAVPSYEIELFAERDVTILDTLQDLEGFDDPPPARPAGVGDERHEQGLSGMLDEAVQDDREPVGAGSA